MQNEKLKELTEISSKFLADDAIDLHLAADFCADLKRSCEELRESHHFTGKKDEQAFCLLLIKNIMDACRLRSFEILSNSLLTPGQKAKQLANLTYHSQCLVALALIQHRFGGRLGYHCLPHTQGIIQYPDSLIACAGANHDAVMRYAKSPAFGDAAIIRMRREYHQERSLLIDSKSPVDETHRQMYAEKRNEIKTLKNLTEQKRIAGWKEGNCERDSADQMEAQIAQIIEMIEERDEGNLNGEAIALFRKQMVEEQAYRSSLIKGTIPNKWDFAAPGLGDKLNTIGNVTVFPNPVELLDIAVPLRNRLVRLMDRIIKEIKGSQALTFQQAVDDIEDARRFYQGVVAEKAANPSADPEEIKTNVRNEIRPRFETLNEKILTANPPFNDPLKQIKEISQEMAVHYFKTSIIQDAHEHNDLAIIEFLMTQIKKGVVANHDLGAVLKADSDSFALKDMIIGLIYEENPYQGQLFFAANQKLEKEGTLGSEEIHIKLREGSNRKKWGITDEEYQNVQEFMDIAYQFINENHPFLQGAILRTRLYIYIPMKALQLAFDDPFLQAKISESDRMTLNKIIREFEKTFCIKGKLRDSVLEKSELFIEECCSAGSLCRCILSAMQNQFGRHFLKAPLEYGYTLGNELDKHFLQEQDNKTPWL